MVNNLLKLVPKGAMDLIRKTSVFLSDNAPKIFVWGGTGLMVTGAVAAFISGMKCGDEVSECLNKERVEFKDVVDAGVVVIKKASLPIGMTVTGAVSVLHGFKILDKRFVGAVATLNLLKQAYDKSQNEIGSFLEIETVSGDPTPFAKDDISNPYVNPDEMYSIMFDEQNPEWQGDPHHNLSHLKNLWEYANRQYFVKGKYTWNDICRVFGGKENNSYGLIAGYRTGMGDNFIDCGLFNPDGSLTDKAMDHINNFSPMKLTFNVSGCIYDPKDIK